jgi:hypothetical protein
MLSDYFRLENGHEYVLVHWSDTVVYNRKIYYDSNKEKDHYPSMSATALERLKTAQITEDEDESKDKILDVEKLPANVNFKIFTWPPSWCRLSKVNNSPNKQRLVEFAKSYSYVSKPELHQFFRKKTDHEIKQLVEEEQNKANDDRKRKDDEQRQGNNESSSQEDNQVKKSKITIASLL